MFGAFPLAALLYDNSFQLSIAVEKFFLLYPHTLPEFPGYFKQEIRLLMSNLLHPKDEVH